MKNSLLLFFVFLFPVLLFAQDEKGVPGLGAFTLDEQELYFLSSEKPSAEEKIKQLLKQASDASEARERPTAIRKLLMAIMIEEAHKPRINLDLAKVHIRFGDYLISAGAWDMGIEHSKKALDYMKRSGEADSGQLYNMIGKVGSYYMVSQQYDSAHVYYLLALAEARKTPDSLWVGAAYNNLGILSVTRGDTASAGDYYAMALLPLSYQSRGDSTFFVSVLDNQAELESQSTNYNKAIEIYTKKIELATTLHMPFQVFKSTLGLARNYLLLNKAGAALTELKNAELILADKIMVNIHNRIELEKVWQLYYEHTGKWQEAALKQKWIIEKNDSLEKTSNYFLNEVLQGMVAGEVAKFKKAVEIHELQLGQKERDLQLAEQEALFNKTLVFVFITLALAVITLIYLFFRNRSNSQKNLIKIKNLEQANLKNQLDTKRYELELTEANLKNRELEKEKLERELEYKKSDMGELALYLSNLKEVNNKMIDRLNEAKNKKPAEQKELIKEISAEMLAQLSSDKKTSIIQENIAQINKEFYDKLKASFPDLTKSELELCGLFRLNMSNKEVAVIKNISPESVKMARYRLRKKLKLASEEDIYKALSAF